jgi:2-polyprenyl-6-methoxyphenol hydroxylase-like FAD-dependent oxidoreductase
MRSIGIIGSGQAGLLLAHGLLRDGNQVTVYSDRTAQQWLDEGRPTGTAVRFATSLAWERTLGLTHGHAEAPTMEGLKVTICSHPAKPLLTLSGRFPSSPLAIDTRLQSARWLEELEVRGGHVVIGAVTPDGIDAIAERHDVTFVATGKDGVSYFARDPVRSPADKPLRNVAMVNCEGPPRLFDGVPFTAAKFNVFEGVGECYWTPYYHKDGKQVWNLVFEAKPGGDLDQFGAATSGQEVLDRCKALIRERMPWDAEWIADATLCDPNSWLVGAITPTVRDPVGRTPGGRLVLPVGDAYMAFDPLGAQGANMGNRLAQRLTEGLAARPTPIDVEWVRTTYDGFYERYGGPSMRWTHLLLEPMAPAARYLFLAQLGADGVSSSSKQRLADAFVDNFDDPVRLGPTLSAFGAARRYVGEAMGGGADWEALKGLVQVVGRQVQNMVT